VKTKFLLICLLLSFSTLCLFSQEDDSIKKVIKGLEIKTFQPGEYLKYVGKLGMIKSGEAVMTVDMAMNGDRAIFHYKAAAYTAGVAKTLYKLRDIYESYVDIETGLPLKSIRNIQESNYTNYDEVLFFRKKGELLSIKKGQKSAPPNVMDILSMFYHMRRYAMENLQPKQILTYVLYFEDKIKHFQVRYIGLETIKTKWGKVRCKKFIPVVEKGKNIEEDDAIKIWITDDENRVPVLVKFDLAIGNIKAELDEYANLKSEIQFIEK